MLAQVGGGRAGRGDDRLGRDRGAHRGEPGLVVGPVVHRVVGHVDDVVARGRAIGQDRGDARHRLRAAIDDAVEIDEQEEAHRPDRSRAPAGAYDGADAPRPTATRSPRPDRLLIDGTNLLHAISKAAGPAGAAPPAALIGRLRGAIPAPVDDRARLRRPARARPAQRADRGRADRPLQRRADGRRRVILTHDRGRPAARRRRRHAPPSSSSPTTATCATASRLRGARTAGSAWLLGPARRRTAARRRRSATRGRRDRHDPSPRPPERRRHGRDRASRLEAGTRRDDQEGQPARGRPQSGGASGGSSGGTGRMPP